MTTTLIEYGTSSNIGPKLVQCQRNSFIRTFESVVMDCKEWSIPSSVDNKRKGKKNKKKSKKKQEKFYEIELKDTILFPEGGGQPTDTGTLSLITDEKTQENPIKVLSVFRNPKGRVLHKSNKQISIGTKVNINLNWSRRHDNMQQHTGQHLISAIFRSELNTPTVSWWMSEYPKSSQIEMKCEKDVNNDDIMRCENIINTIIANGHLITTHVFHDNTAVDKFAAVHSKFKTKALPEGAGPLRVIEIPEVEYNVCCGTHLGNTAQLQMIKIVSWDFDKNNCNLKINFVSGGRICHNYNEMFLREKEIGTLLSCGNDQYVRNIDKIQKDIKMKGSLLRGVEKRLIELEIERFINMVKNGKGNIRCVYEHFVNGNNKMLQGISDGILNGFKGDKDMVIFIMFSMGVSNKSGQYIMATNDNKLLTPKNKENKQKILKFIDGSGGGKVGRLQGKAKNFKGFKQLFEWVNNLYDNDGDNDENECKTEVILPNEMPSNALNGLNQIIDILDK